ncbi:MAG TPA: flavin reductase family protein [Thermoanaerobaculia bacterium]|nr:flavin reductase family protein [Thermoanaerobaculia bacterium]
MNSRAFRDLLGSFATGVTVITTNDRGRLHGMTANAVCSVSLDPLLLLVCVDRRAHCHQQVLAAERFAVNVLGADQRALSDLFAHTQEPEVGELRGAPFRLAEHGVPILDGTLAHVECRLAAAHRAGDHDIFVGEALAGRIEREDPPLVFFRGRYRVLG